MFSTDGIAMPDLTNHDDMVRFVKELLERYEAAQSLYSNRQESKSQASVKDVYDKVVAEDPEAVQRAENAAENFRSIILAHVNANPNVAVALFPIMQELTKVVGSYRAETTVTVSPVQESDDDRDLLAEYEALDKAQTTITGTMMMAGITPSELPEKFTAKKMQRVNGKNVPTGELTFKFPGQLRKPNEEGTSTSAGRTATTESWLWEIEDRETEATISIGKCAIATLARLSSSTDDLLSFSDLKDRLDNHRWMDKDTHSLVIDVPRGKLIGIKVSK